MSIAVGRPHVGAFATFSMPRSLSSLSPSVAARRAAAAAARSVDDEVEELPRFRGPGQTGAGGTTGEPWPLHRRASMASTTHLCAETGKEAEFHLRQKPPPQFDAWWSHARALQLTMEVHGYVYTHA